MLSLLLFATRDQLNPFLGLLSALGVWKLIKHAHPLTNEYSTSVIEFLNTRPVTQVGKGITLLRNFFAPIVRFDFWCIWAIPLTFWGTFKVGSPYDIEMQIRCLQALKVSFWEMGYDDDFKYTQQINNSAATKLCLYKIPALSSPGIIISDF